MEIKNEALKSLYEDLVSDIWSFSIEAAFKKCDDELEKEKLMTDNNNAALQHTVDDFVVKCKDLQSAYDKEHSRWVELAENYDRLETRYRLLEREHSGEVDARKKCTYFENLSTERFKAIEELMQKLDAAEKEREAIREESLRNIREGYKTECDLKELRQKYDDLHRRHERMCDIRNRLTKENEDLKQQIKSLESEFEEEHKARITRDGLCVEKERRIICLKQENEDLKQQNKKLGESCEEEHNTSEYWRLQCKGRGDRIRNLEKENEDLRRQVSSLNTAMGRLRERYEEEVVCRRKWAKLAGYRDKRIEELLKTGYGIDADEVYKLKGMEELWSMLGEMYSADPIEVTKIFGWFSINNIAHYTPDVSEFLKKFKTWKSGKEEKEAEQKRLDYMRDYLHRFCLGKVCYGCPLNTSEFKCCGHGGFDSISDEDVKRYYEKARNSFKEEKTVEEVPCSFGWKLDGTEFTIETSIPRKDYDNIVKIISGKE